MTRVLVTGASGFIGRAVVTAFARSGQTLRAAARRLPQPAFTAGVEVMQHPDLSQPFDWGPLLEGMDQVVHLAGIAHTGPGVAPELYDRVNRAATAELAAAAAQAGVRQFVRRPTPMAVQNSPPKRRCARPAFRSRSCGRPCFTVRV